MKKPRGWKAKSREAYEAGGKSIGRILMYDKSQEERIWGLVSGIKLWPRWYLMAFRTHYIKDNPQEYNRMKNAMMRRRRKLRAQTHKLQKTRQQAMDLLD